MTRARVAVLLLVVACVTLVCSLSLRADPPKYNKGTDDLFSGKILMITQRATSYGATLEDVHVTRVGDQTFLVGKGIDESKGWYNGRTVFVSLAEVTQIAEFDDRADLIKTQDSRKAAGQ
jgi:hypothetical protein